jgi:hypothetical protein
MRKGRVRVFTMPPLPSAMMLTPRALYLSFGSGCPRRFRVDHGQTGNYRSPAGEGTFEMHGPVPLPGDFLEIESASTQRKSF